MNHRKGLLAISPLIFFILFYLTSALITGNFSKIPIVVAFLFASVYALVITRKLKLSEKVMTYCKGAGSPNVLFMIMIFVMAGAFAQCASDMGCISETVNMILKLLPPKLIYASLFIAGCFISIATGSGIGSIVALGPIAVGVAESSSASMPLMCALVVCGAMFGDNLSFISDTTILSTSSQGCELKDKFRTNFLIVLPPAILLTLLYIYLGADLTTTVEIGDVQYLKILPYIAVITMSVCGMNVLLVLLLGVLICGIMGLVGGDFDFLGWLTAIEQGINGMSAFIIIIVLAAGMIAMIEHNGGIAYIVSLCTRFIRGRKSAEACICILTALVCICTANNTVTIISVGDIVRGIAQRYGVAPRKAASLMDISSCVLQELTPYSTHLLVAAGFAGITTLSIIPYVFYAYLLAISLVISVLFNIPRIKEEETKTAGDPETVLP